jgi:hypothetical protein
VHALLGSTAFTTSGAILKKNGQSRRTIDIKASMKKGAVEDLLKLAMAGNPILEGRIDMDAAIKIPPIAGKVKEKLIVDATFNITDGWFRKSQIRQRLDALSRRAQGEPKNLEIEDVMTALGGKVHLEDQQINFPMLNFSIPGARVSLTGTYGMDDQQLDFNGTASMDAKVSQMLTGWKRFLAKPFDPLFAHDGSGTRLPITIQGTADHPQFSVSIRKAIPGPIP